MPVSIIFYGFSVLYFALALVFLAEVHVVDFTLLGRLTATGAWILVFAFSALAVFSLMFAHLCERLAEMERSLRRLERRLAGAADETPQEKAHGG